MGRELTVGRNPTRTPRLIAGCIVLLGCGVVAALGFVLLVKSGRPLLPSSREYRPVSAREARLFATARRDIYPEDVRRDVASYADTTVVWAGIIRRLDLQEEGGALVMRFETEHRYFDWIEDNSARSAIYYPSDTGEGTFHVAWTMPSNMRDAVERNTHVGDMIIAYGQPAQHEDKVGLYPCVYVRPVPRALCDDSVLSYGRSEPTPPGAR